MPRKVDYLKRLQKLNVQAEELITDLIREKEQAESALRTRSVNPSSVDFEALDMKTLVDLHARISAVLYEKSKTLNTTDGVY